MKINTIGEILRFYREKYNLKQSDVCAGICSVASLSKIENGSKEADSLTLEILLGRIGKEALQFEMILNDYDYSLWELRRQIETEMQHDRKENARQLLQEYEEKMPQDDNVHSQFVLYHRILLEDDNQTEDKCAMAVQALKYTCSDIEEAVLYHETEIELIIFLVQNRYAAFKNGRERLVSVLKVVEDIYTGRRKEQISAKLLMELTLLEWRDKHYQGAIRYADKAIEVISHSRGIGYVGELHLIKAKALEKYYHGKDWDKEEDNCKNECLMAYYTFDIMKNKMGKEEVQKFCEEKLQWQIIKQEILSDSAEIS